AVSGGVIDEVGASAQIVGALPKGESVMVSIKGSRMMKNAIDDVRPKIEKAVRRAAKKAAKP
ncbi:MAG: hypothetical protein RSE34_00805, partial [Brevundimonas sp.]